ncbi:copper-binding protein [Bradyrhizobium sp.]|uniref:copper-binding protein n=1 Tax=Bradyrhizobium sp. TaxID=376 RepID=UPI0025C65D32|nr:copper-binding protein [Bradyrhizobium sp.]
MARTVLVGSMLAMIPSMAVAQPAPPAAPAPLTGTVTMVNRISATITIQPTQSGTVGANIGAAEQYKIQGSMLNTLHAGDRVTFSVSEMGGSKTITKIDKQ